MDNLEIKLSLPWLLSVVKNLRKVSHNIRLYEEYLGNQYDWNEAMGLSENRKYIESLEDKLKKVINDSVEIVVKKPSEEKK
jgi:hypothetical protein